MQANLINRFRFFHAHAGYRVGFRAVDALSLARAEKAAAELDWTYAWEYDPDADWSWLDQDCFKSERDKEHCVETCQLFDANGEQLDCLGGIFDADKDYRRVVEAELALEADAVRVLALQKADENNLGQRVYSSSLRYA